MKNKRENTISYSRLISFLGRLLSQGTLVNSTCLYFSEEFCFISECPVIINSRINKFVAYWEHKQKSQIFLCEEIYNSMNYNCAIQRFDYYRNLVRLQKNLLLVTEVNNRIWSLLISCCSQNINDLSYVDDSGYGTHGPSEFVGHSK